MYYNAVRNTELAGFEYRQEYIGDCTKTFFSTVYSFMLWPLVVAKRLIIDVVRKFGSFYIDCSCFITKIEKEKG